MLKRLIAEPLVQFLVVGAGVMVAYWLVNRASQSDAERQIVVSAQQIKHLETMFQRTWQRQPTEEELNNLVDDFVLGEIYFRQAVALRLDRDDAIIRRRLRQKLEFFVDDASSYFEPTEEDLAAYLKAHAEKFQVSPTYTFEQLYFNPDKLGADPKQNLAKKLEELREGNTVEGHVSLLTESFSGVSRPQIDRTFGTGFSQHLDDLVVGQWDAWVRASAEH